MRTAAITAALLTLAACSSGPSPADAMDDQWNSVSQANRVRMCAGYEDNPELAVDLIMDGLDIGGDTIVIGGQEFENTAENRRAAADRLDEIMFEGDGC